MADCGTLTVTEPPTPAGFGIGSVSAPDTIQPGAGYSITVSVDNNGEESGDAEVVAGDTSLGTRTVDGGGSAIFSATIGETGTFDVEVINKASGATDDTRSVTVTEQEPGNGDPPDEPPTDGMSTLQKTALWSGVGALGGIGTVLARRR